MSRLALRTSRRKVQRRIARVHILATRLLAECERLQAASRDAELDPDERAALEAATGLRWTLQMFIAVLESATVRCPGTPE